MAENRPEHVPAPNADGFGERQRARGERSRAPPGRRAPERLSA